MKAFIRSLPSSAINLAFGITYGIALLLALFPPLYLAASGSRASVLGMPFSLSYWILDALLIGVALWVKYTVEDIRGELDEVLDVVTTEGSHP